MGGIRSSSFGNGRDGVREGEVRVVEEVYVFGQGDWMDGVFIYGGFVGEVGGRGEITVVFKDRVFQKGLQG